MLTLISNQAYADLVQGTDIDIAISPQQITIGSILTELRQGDVVAVHSLRRGTAEAIEGIAYLNCTVKETRALDCVEGMETPVGYGFSSAALQISRLFVVREDYPGVTPGMAVRLPVRFKVE